MKTSSATMHKGSSAEYAGEEGAGTRSSTEMLGPMAGSIMFWQLSHVLRARTWDRITAVMETAKRFIRLARSTDGGLSWKHYDPPNFEGDGGVVSPPPAEGVDFTAPALAHQTSTSTGQAGR